MKHALLITKSKYIVGYVKARALKKYCKEIEHQPKTRYYVILNPKRQLILQKAPTLVNPSRLEY